MPTISLLWLPGFPTSGKHPCQAVIASTWWGVSWENNSDQMLGRPAIVGCIHLKIGVGAVVMVWRNEEGGKGWVMCPDCCNKEALRGRNVQAGGPGPQMVQSSVELVWNGYYRREIWSQRGRCFLRSERPWSRARARCGRLPWKEVRKEVGGELWNASDLSIVASGIHIRQTVLGVLPSA